MHLSAHMVPLLLTSTPHSMPIFLLLLPFLSSFFQITDFNLSKLIADQGNSSVAAMNPRWLAPELMQGEQATLASGVFAFGVVLWEVMTWKLPWGSANPWTVSCLLGGGEPGGQGIRMPACTRVGPAERLIGLFGLTGLFGLLSVHICLPALPALLQLVSLVTQGGRLEIPPRERLPGGADTAAFGGLDAYVALTKRCWAHNPYDRPTFEEIIPQLRCGGAGLIGWMGGLVGKPSRQVQLAASWPVGVHPPNSKPLSSSPPPALSQEHAG